MHYFLLSVFCFQCTLTNVACFPILSLCFVISTFSSVEWLLHKKKGTGGSGLRCCVCLFVHQQRTEDCSVQCLHDPRTSVCWCWNTGYTPMHWCHYGLRDCHTSKKLLLQNQCLSARLKIKADHMDKEKAVSSTESHELFGHSDKIYRETL